VGEDDVLKLDVQIVPMGTPEPVALGEAMLTQPTTTVKLRGKVADMPEQLEVDVSQLKIGESIHAGELPLPPGVDLISSPESTLFTVQVIRAVTEADLTPAVEGEEGAGEEEEGEGETEEEAS
jgi:large subunit ribosomal protein L25